MISDATADERLRGHPGLELYGIRAYVAVPLYCGQGDYFGTLCALDPEPRAHLEGSVELLQHFARLVAFQMATEDAQKDRELLIATLGHDLRGPINALQLQNEIALRDATLQPTTRSALEMSKDSIRRMTSMTSEILDYTRIRSGRGVSLRIGIVETVTLVNKVLREAVPEEFTGRVRIEALGDTTLLADPGRLHRIVQNLLGNALSHSPEASPVTVSVDGRSKDRVRLEVHNLGSIPTHAMPDLFSPFSGNSASEGHGYGLGLFIVAELVRLHGGEVQVESDTERGTTFAIELPRREKEEVE